VGLCCVLGRRGGLMALASLSCPGVMNLPWDLIFFSSIVFSKPRPLQSDTRSQDSREYFVVLLTNPLARNSASKEEEPFCSTRSPVFVTSSFGLCITRVPLNVLLSCHGIRTTALYRAAQVRIQVCLFNAAIARIRTVNNLRECRPMIDRRWTFHSDKQAK